MVHLLRKVWKPRRRGHHAPKPGAKFEPVRLNNVLIKALPEGDKNQFLASTEVFGFFQ